MTTTLAYIGCLKDLINYAENPEKTISDLEEDLENAKIKIEGLQRFIGKESNSS